jgi:hypothetical protein
VFPNAWGITQGDGHDNTYTHNDVYDGYHAAIGACQCTADVPNSHGTFNNTISFNHLYNLFQGIMNDGGSLYFGVGNAVFTAAGNRILNNKVHDVSDASAMDADGYGGHGIYLDDQTGLTDVENNLVYRVSDAGINFSGAPFAPNQQNTVKNNIFAFARLAMINNSNFFLSGSIPANADQVFVATSNLMYFDRNSSSSPAFYVQGGCTYTGGFPYTAYQQWTSNLYWRTEQRIRKRHAGIPRAAKARSCRRPVTEEFRHGLSTPSQDGRKARERTRKAWSRIPGSITRPIRRMIIPCLKGHPAWDSWFSTRRRPAA